MNIKYPYPFSDYRFDLNADWLDNWYNDVEKLSYAQRELTRVANERRMNDYLKDDKTTKGDGKPIMRNGKKVCLRLSNNNYVTIDSIKIPKENKVVIVRFSDGTEEKAVCDENDVFDFKTALTICILKKLAGGSNNYHKVLDEAVNLYNSQNLKKEEEKIEQDRIKARKAKNAEKKAKRAAKKREDQIEMQKEAYLRAMSERACGKRTEIKPVDDDI